MSYIYDETEAATKYNVRANVIKSKQIVCPLYFSHNLTTTQTVHDRTFSSDYNGAGRQNSMYLAVYAYI